ESFDVSDLPCQVACQVKPNAGSDGAWNPDDWMDSKERRKIDDFILFGVAAATQALRDAGWAPTTDEDRNSTGVMIGSGIGGLGGIYETSVILYERGPRRVSPF